MKQNPCRYCALSTEYKGRHSPSWKEQCAECESYKKHKEYLQSKRMFEKGERITTLDELKEQEWVIWHEQTKHIKVIMNFPFAMVITQLNNGNFYKAIKKRKRGLRLWQRMRWQHRTHREHRKRKN